MDLTKLVFTSGGGKDRQTWPRTMFKSSKNHLCAQGLNFEYNRPDFLRLNSTGDITPEDLRGETRGTVKKGILGEYTQSRIPVENMFTVESVKNLDQMPNRNNRKCPTVNACRTAFSAKESNGFNFNMAHRQYRYPSFGAGCRPIPPWQQFGNAYPYWFFGNHGVLLGNPFGGNGYPAPFPSMAPFANVQPANHRSLPEQFYRRETQNNQRQKKNKHSKKSPAHGKGEEHTKNAQSATAIDSVVDSLSELKVTSENNCSQKNEFQTNEAPKSAPLQMCVSLHSTERDKDMNAQILKSQRKESKEKEDIPSVQQKVCDNYRKCSSEGECMGVGYCLLSPANGTGKVTVVLDKKENVRKLSNAKGKNGYHNKESTNSKKMSDEIVPSQNMSDYLHHSNVGAINSSHSSPGAQPKGGKTSTPSNSHLVARVILQRNSSSKRKSCRRSAKRRQRKSKESPHTTETNASATNKKQKVNHREIDNQVPSATSVSRSSPCSTIAYILGIGSAKENEVDVESVPSHSNDVALIHCKVSVKPEKFSFTISSSDDTDFSDDDDVVALSEDDMDIWNSLSKCDDPYNPMNFLTSTCTSTPKPIPKNNSAPSLLSPEMLQNDEVWKKDTPSFSPPKPEALMRTAKKVRFAEMSTVQVYAADDWERKGPWEQLALDSQRFQKRINRTNEAIGHIFDAQHRHNIQQQLELFRSSINN